VEETIQHLEVMIVKLRVGAMMDIGGIWKLTV